MRQHAVNISTWPWRPLCTAAETQTSQDYFIENPSISQKFDLMLHILGWIDRPQTRTQEKPNPGDEIKHTLAHTGQEEGFKDVTDPSALPHM